MEKINFTNGKEPVINGANLNQLQTNVGAAITEVEKNAKKYADGIIESGSNANGDYIKFADGTMLCWKTYTFSVLAFNIAWGSVYETVYQDFGTTPQTFISKPIIFANNGEGAMVGMQGLDNVSTTSFGGTQLYRPVNGTASGSINLLAIGRWKEKEE